MDEIRFTRAKNRVFDEEAVKKGIGTLSEKTIHSVLKYYFEDDEERHEIKVGSFVADICNDNGIIEVQTGNFNKLRRKLDYFLQDNVVTVVYPIPATKWLVWIDEKTGEETSRRKSPKKGSVQQIFYELYKIKPYILNKNLKFKMVFIDMIEYRLLNGYSEDRKRGSSRYDRIPLDIVDEVNIDSTEDYKRLIPDGIDEEFTSADYKKASGLTMGKAQTALNVLTYVGALERVGKKGRSILYKR